MKPFTWPVRVYYEDTDAAGVVYHSRYLNFLERARTEWLRQLGINQEAFFQQSGLRFAVASMNIQFLAPAVLDDLLEVTVALHQRGHASIHLHQQLTNSQKILLTAQVRIACVNPRFKPARLPDLFS